MAGRIASSAAFPFPAYQPSCGLPSAGGGTALSELERARISRKLAIFCAERVLHIFEEQYSIPGELWYALTEGVVKSVVP